MVRVKFVVADVFLRWGRDAQRRFLPPIEPRLRWSLRFRDKESDAAFITFSCWFALMPQALKDTKLPGNIL